MTTTESAVIACQGGRATQLELRARPRAEAGELILALRVVGLCGTDLFKLSTDAVTPGQVLGHELVGTVVEVGSGMEAGPGVNVGSRVEGGSGEDTGLGVDGFAVGDRVVVPHHVPCGECPLCRRGSETLCTTFRENLLFPGAFAEHVRVLPRAVRHAALRIPDAVTDQMAVFVEPGACVMRGINRAGIPPDGTAAIFGAGAMGLLHLLLIRAAHPGVKTVVIDPLEARRTLAMELGATMTAGVGEVAHEGARELSDQLGVDTVFDTVGGTGLLDDALAMTREGGTVVLFAHAPGGARADFDLNTLFKFERRVMGSYSGSIAEQRQVFELLCDGRFDPTPLVSHQLPLDAFEQGLQLAFSQRALKILFTPRTGVT